MDIIEHQNKTNDRRHPWELARLEVVYSFISKHLTKQSVSNILDVGCGDTFVVSELQKRMPKSNFFAIDTAFSNEMINTFHQEGISLFQNIEDLESKIEKADLVLLMDVIEHIEDDKSFLMDLVSRDYIKDDSLFLITVPAYQSLFSAHDVFLKHYRRYARKQLIATLKSTGFEIIESGNFFSSLLVPRVLALIKEKIMGRKEAKGLAAWQGSEKQSKLLKETLLLDFKTTKAIQGLGIKLPGLSTYALCRKSVL
jgi:2-polyprenyl-3-methyl-5-hydroxy-6-metoxy-1,4-benzoquinol methylase